MLSSSVAASSCIWGPTACEQCLDIHVSIVGLWPLYQYGGMQDDSHGAGLRKEPGP
jgi:hypothetical protein